MDGDDLDRDANGRISVTLPQALRAKLKEVAVRNGDPVSASARKLLARALTDSDSRDGSGGLAA